MGYKPYRPTKNEPILERAMEHVKSVPYRVTLRWLFYRLLQDGFYSSKGDYDNKFEGMMSEARKRFYNGWHPDTLADDTREAVIRGGGFANEDEWLEAIGQRLECTLDKWANQPHYVELWFEARAMRGQFEHHTDHVTLVPFGGDPSIPYKWAMAKRLEERAKLYGKPIVILYFGDLDPKGRTIPESAAADVQDWCAVDFEFTRCALKLGDEVAYNIPENPDKPGQYQWEALSDEAAKELITKHVGGFTSLGGFSEIEKAEQEITTRFAKKWTNFIRQGGNQ